MVEDGKFETSVLKNVEPQTYTRLYAGLAEAIEKEDGELVPVKLSEARDVLRIIALARESAKAERTIAF